MVGFGGETLRQVISSVGSASEATPEGVSEWHDTCFCARQKQVKCFPEAELNSESHHTEDTSQQYLKKKRKKESAREKKEKTREKEKKGRESKRGKEKGGVRERKTQRGKR